MNSEKTDTFFVNQPDLGDGYSYGRGGCLDLRLANYFVPAQDGRRVEGEPATRDLRCLDSDLLSS